MKFQLDPMVGLKAMTVRVNCTLKKISLKQPKLISQWSRWLGPFCTRIKLIKVRSLFIDVVFMKFTLVQIFRISTLNIYLSFFTVNLVIAKLKLLMDFFLYSLDGIAISCLFLSFFFNSKSLFNIIVEFF